MGCAAFKRLNECCYTFSTWRWCLVYTVLYLICCFILFYRHLNNFKCKNSKLQESRSLNVLKFWYTKCLHLTTNKKYINFLMRQAKVRDYYGDVILYNFFEHLNIVKWKNSKLESCRSRRGLQFSYKNYLHPMSYRRVMIFRRFSRNKLEKGKTKPRLL
jgi:hypothetical protein